MNFKTRLKNKDTLIGSIVTFGSTDVAEVMSLIGFDYLWIDVEHSPLDFGQAQRMIQAVGKRCPCIIRVPENKEVWLKKALDTGCDGILIPQVKTAEEARSAVRWSLYPPQGERSVGISRAQGYGLGFEEYIREANDKTAIIVQVEHVEAVNNIEAIAGVAGIDAILVGPYDLSASMGIPGQVKDDKVTAAIRKVQKQCEQVGMAVGIFAAEGETAKGYIKAGFSLIGLGLDTVFLWQAARKALAQVRNTD